MRGRLGNRIDGLMWLIRECKYIEEALKRKWKPQQQYVNSVKKDWKAKNRLEKGHLKVLGVWNLVKFKMEK